MDGIRELLSAARDHGLADAHFRGLLHVAIGRTITRLDGTVVSTGVTWRALAPELKTLRFDQQLVRQFGIDPDQLAARERERFWYLAIGAARVDSPEAVQEGDALVPKLKALGYLVGPPPASLVPALPPPPAKSKPVETKPPVAKGKEKDSKGAKKKKK